MRVEATFSKANGEQLDSAIQSVLGLGSQDVDATEDIDVQEEDTRAPDAPLRRILSEGDLQVFFRTLDDNPVPSLDGTDEASLMKVCVRRYIDAQSALKQLLHSRGEEQGSENFDKAENVYAVYI